jgi:HD-GYP domain-containing protein (c-di-GMP phosphodiesterase class II)
MTDTETLQKKIAALRRQLQELQGVSQETTSLESEHAPRIRRLEHQVSAGHQETALLNSTLHQLLPAASLVAPVVLPKQLTARARQTLEHGRELLDRLRRLSEESATGSTEAGIDSSPVESTSPNPDFSANRYDEATAMVEAVLRMIQVLPDAPSAQLRLCEGIEAILESVAERIARLDRAIAVRRRDASAVQRLAELLGRLHAGTAVAMDSVTAMASAIIADAQNGEPLRFLSASAEEPARFVAAHSLMVAQVAARVGRHDPDYRKDLHQPVVAAVLHDVGMLQIPAEILAKPGTLEDAQRRLVEAHPQAGAEILIRLLPSGAWLAESAAGHHERLDGTGYPAGLRDYQLPALTRFIMVCDVYAAMISPRPQRDALDTRTALADTLLLAEKGLFDRIHAERLLQLSFYPVGSVVELADGGIGVVVATHRAGRDLTVPARPVLALLTDREGRLLPFPHHLDLAQCESRSILRALKPKERPQLLRKRYPELV